MKEGDGALMHVYVLEHIVSLSYRSLFIDLFLFIFTKLCRDVKVLMVRDLYLGSSANSSQEWVQDRAKIGEWDVSSPKDFLTLEGYSDNRMHRNDIEAFGKKCCYILFHSDAFWRLFRLCHFWRILMIFLYTFMR